MAASRPAPIEIAATVPTGRFHAQAILQKVRALAAVNPMLAHRGVRLGESHPEIPSLQIQAILAAAAEQG